jgi:hypothetical protein
MKKLTLNYTVSLCEPPLQKLKGNYHHQINILSHYLIFLLLFAFCFLPSNLFAQRQQKIEVQTKVFTKNYTVKPKDLLALNTRYSKVTFQEWDKNEVDLIATVKLKNATEKDMEELLKSFEINTNQSGRRISYSLSISWNNNGRNRNIDNNYEISLLVKIPKDIFIDIGSRYGNVELINAHNDFNAVISYGNLNVEKMHGNSNNIEIKYGNFSLENSSGMKNKIDIKYGKFDIGVVNQLSLNIGYSKGNLNEVDLLKLNSKYCTVKFDKVKSLEMSSGYDKITIRKNVDKIEGEMKYGTFSIGALKTSCILSSFSYSKITIDEVLSSFTNISIEASYSHIYLSIPKDQSFVFDYSGRYTDFKDKNIRLNDATFEAEANSTVMRGIYGKNSDSGKKVKVQARYGSVSLFER